MLDLEDELVEGGGDNGRGCWNWRMNVGEGSSEDGGGCGKERMEENGVEDVV